MKKKIYVIIVIVSMVLLSAGCSLFNGEKDPNEYLNRKYSNIQFTFVEKYDSGSKWSKYHYKDEYGNDVVVSCTNILCNDNYYAIYNKDKIDSYIYNELRKINSLPVEYKYANVGNNGLGNEDVTLDTEVYDVSKKDSSYTFTGPVIIFVKNNVQLSKEDFRAFKDSNINVQVYLIPEDDYNMLSTDSRNYVYDYITKHDISSGVNSKYAHLSQVEKEILTI